MSLALRRTQQQQAHPGSVYFCVALLESFKSQQRAVASLHSLSEIRHPKPIHPRTCWNLPSSLSLYHLYLHSSIPLWFSGDRGRVGERDIKVAGKTQRRKNTGNKRWSGTKCISYPGALLPLQSLYGIRTTSHPSRSDYQPRGEGFSMWLAFLSSQSGPLQRSRGPVMLCIWVKFFFFFGWWYWKDAEWHLVQQLAARFQFRALNHFINTLWCEFIPSFAKLLP